MFEAIRRTIAAVLALVAYAGTVLPQTRRLLRHRRRSAAAISDPTRRAVALAALAEKRMNVEAVAVFAILAPWRARRRALAAIVALQVAIDYLDSVDEAAGGTLEERLRRHRGLAIPLAAADDGPLRVADTEDPYLGDLLRTAAHAFAGLAGAAPIAPFLAAAVTRCGEGQAHTHAGATDPGALEAWGRTLGGEPWRWWELAAGACSSVAAHALIAAASRSTASAEVAGRIDAAYFPSVGALTVLLDDLVDIVEDERAGEHNYVRYYGTAEEAAERLRAMEEAADDAVGRLPGAWRHRAILDGVAGFYLSSPGARTAFAAPARRALLEGLGSVRVLLAFMGLRRRV